jgi:phosphatidylglycerol:prolipoprotein diacylglycerol transferase
VPTLIAAIGWPVLDRIRIGSAFAISPHGLGIAIGFLTGAWLFGKLAPPRGISAEQVNGIVFWSLIGAIVGSRLFYVIAHYSEFRNLGEMLAIWRGGISLLGGIAGAVLVNTPRVRSWGFRFFQVADPIVICLSLGIAIGRIGDLIIGDHLGKPTSWLLAWTYHGGTLAPPFVCANGICQAQLQNGQIEEIRRTGAALYGPASVPSTFVPQGVGVHQTALYDMLLVGLLFALLWRLDRRPRREGILTLTFGLWYGIERILEDSLRIDKRFGPFTGSQWTAIVVAIVSAGLLLWWAVHPKEGPPTDTGPPSGDARDGADDAPTGGAPEERHTDSPSAPEGAGA